MGIILFLVDTSASMNQKTYLGTSYLDVAKGAIDTFMKYRARDPASAGDHYMLVSFDDPPTAVKVGWEKGTFVTELKNLQALGVSVFGQSLKESLDLLNINRLHTGIDHYGQGRNPFFLEPAVIIALTDGGQFNKPSGEIDEELILPRNGTSEGSELTKEPFRWDQRIFVVLLQMAGLNGVAGGNEGDEEEGEGVASPASRYLSTLCENTGGRCYIGSNAKTLAQSMESISQKLHHGVVLNFRKIGSDQQDGGGEEMTSTARDNRGKSHEGSLPPDGSKIKNGESKKEEEEREVSPSSRANAWHNTRRMIFVRPNPKTNIPSGHWPIPESFWPDSSSSILVPRNVHPIVWFNATSTKPRLLESFAFDKYELEPSPLTQHILEKRDPNLCWQVFISDCGKEKGITSPFGYLKPSSTGNFVNLFVMPFNYPKLLPLIEELQRQQLRPTSKWRSEFAEYISTVPNYYAQPLRKALQLMGAHPSLVPDPFDGQMSYSITNYLKKLKKQAKTSILAKLNAQANRSSNSTTTDNKRRVDLGDGSSIAIGSTDEELGLSAISSQSYRNPFNVPRRSLLSQVARMRANFLFSSTNTPHLIEEVSRHQVPIGQMGNYQKHLKRINPLRELDTGAVRTQLFGNPFKLEKPSDKGNVADEIMVEHLNKRPGGGGGASSHRSSRRQRPRSPSPMPPPQAPPTDNDKYKNHKPTQSNEAKNNGGLNATPSVAVTTDIEVIEIDSSSMINESNEEAMDLADALPPVTGSDKDPILPDPRPPPVLSVQVESNSVNDKKGELMLTNETLKDSLLPVNRKRTPSPTSVTHLPLSKKFQRDPSQLSSSSSSSLKPVNSTDSVGKSSTGKSPSPSPLTVPLTAPPTIRPSGLLSSASQVLNEEFKRKQLTENLKIKQLITKEIRKHSKNYDPIFQHLDTIQGTADTKRAFVQDIIKEAERFRKKQLVALLHDWTLGLPKASTSSNNSKIKSSNTGR